MTRKERLNLLKQIEKDIHVCSLESTLLDDAKSCAIHFVIEELEQAPCDDAISRQAVIDGINRYFHDEYYQRTSIQDCRDCLIEDVINELPPVKPQEPTEWQQDHEILKAYSDGANEMLDKIRSEVEGINPWALAFAPSEYRDTRPKIVARVKSHILEIIEKYKEDA